VSLPTGIFSEPAQSGACLSGAYADLDGTDFWLTSYWSLRLRHQQRVQLQRIWSRGIGGLAPLLLSLAKNLIYANICRIPATTASSNSPEKSGCLQTLTLAGHTPAWC
jgi:hypothetical protein